jgi:hypothetical protein
METKETTTELNSIRTFIELNSSANMLGNLRASMNKERQKKRDHLYKFVQSRTPGEFGLIVGNIETSYTWHGDYETDKIGAVSLIANDYIAQKDSNTSLQEEDYVLGLFMNDPSRPEAVVSAIGAALVERRMQH